MEPKTTVGPQQPERPGVADVGDNGRLRGVPTISLTGKMARDAPGPEPRATKRITTPLPEANTARALALSPGPHQTEP